MDDDRRTPAASAWTMPAVAAASSHSGGHRAAPRRGRRRAPVAACLVGAVVLLAGLGAAGPPAPVTAAEVLPPPDLSAFGATGRLPDPVPAPLPLPLSLPPGTLPLDDTSIPDGPSVGGSALGIPETVLAAYRAAATTMERTAPDCRLTWPLVAGIGKVESGHASGGAVDADGTTRRPILGPELTGTDGNAAIPDTDGGALDHDATWDRAVGPTQFIPSSWRIYGADGNGDGRADPDNVFDAGLATARYLCSSGGDLSGATARHDAVFRYNHSEDYVATVLRWADAYASGALPVPDTTGPGDGNGGLADGPIVDGAPTLAALPSPSSRIPTAGGVPATAAGSPVAGSPVGAVPPTLGGALNTAPEGPRVVAAPAPAPIPAPAAPPASSMSAAPPTAPGTPAPKPTSAATSASTASASTTSASTTSASTTSSITSPTTAPTSTSATTSSTAPKPAPPSAPVPAKPAPTRPTPPSTTSSTTASSSTTSSTATSPSTPDPSTRCTAALPAVARAFGVTAAQLSAADAAGPGTGRTTCTVRGPRGPLLIAVTAAPGATAPAPPAGISRAVGGGRTMLSVPAASGVPDDRARAALATLAGAWG